MYTQVVSFIAVLNLVGADEQPLTIVTNGVQSSTESIKSIHAKYIIKTVGDALTREGTPFHESSTIEKEWWQKGKVVKYSEAKIRKPEDPSDPLFRESKGQALVTEASHLSTPSKSTRLSSQKMGQASRWSGVITANGDEYGIFSDLWVRALTTFAGGPKKTLAEILLDRSIKKDISQVQLDDNEYFRITFNVNKMETEVLVDPAHNFMVKRRVSTTGDALLNEEVVSFQEVSPGIYFPKVVRVNSRKTFVRKDNKQTLTMKTDDEVEFTLVEVNENIPDNRLTLDFPPGTNVVDEFERTSYVLGDDGRPIGEPDIAPSASPDSPSEKASNRSKARIKYLVVVAIALIAAGVIVFGVRARNRRSKAKDA